MIFGALWSEVRHLKSTWNLESEKDGRRTGGRAEGTGKKPPQAGSALSLVVVALPLDFILRGE